ncbi:MAG: hypothetical protein DMF22_03995 [Verrucomicrobia bacterium]|nr:MAG: hypothetical protein DMF22_03995 [Verrucomicrobiota bacterium]
MFVGHYGVAFAVRSERNQIPLWVLFVAVQLLDFLWAPFVLLGIERVRMVPGITATNSLDLYYMPYTHSLIGALVWSALAFLVYKVASRTKVGAALIVALAVFSHWILDLIVHRPDLAIYDDTLKVGFGLWNYRGIEFVLEIGILLCDPRRRYSHLSQKKRFGRAKGRHRRFQRRIDSDSGVELLCWPAACFGSNIRNNGSNLLYISCQHCIFAREAVQARHWTSSSDCRTGLTLRSGSGAGA